MSPSWAIILLKSWNRAIHYIQPWSLYSQNTFIPSHFLRNSLWFQLLRSNTCFSYNRLSFHTFNRWHIILSFNIPFELHIKLKNRFRLKLSRQNLRVAQGLSPLSSFWVLLLQLLKMQAITTLYLFIKHFCTICNWTNIIDVGSFFS